MDHKAFIQTILEEILAELQITDCFTFTYKSLGSQNYYNGNIHDIIEIIHANPPPKDHQERLRHGGTLIISYIIDASKLKDLETGAYIDLSDPYSIDLIKADIEFCYRLYSTYQVLNLILKSPYMIGKYLYRCKNYIWCNKHEIIKEIFTIRKPKS